jgi:hypothetical protein
VWWKTNFHLFTLSDKQQLFNIPIVCHRLMGGKNRSRVYMLQIDTFNQIYFMTKVTQWLKFLKCFFLKTNKTTYPFIDMLDYESFNYYCNLFQIVVVIINFVICHVDQRLQNGDLGPCQWKYSSNDGDRFSSWTGYWRLIWRKFWILVILYLNCGL